MLAAANHLSCWRSCPLARRNRTASDAAESVKVKTNASTTRSARSLIAPVNPSGLSTNGKS